MPANDRIEVRFPVKTVAPGQGVGELILTAGELTDAAQFSFPVWSPLSKHVEAVYGHLDEGAAAYPIQLPADIVIDALTDYVVHGLYQNIRVSRR